MLSLGCVEEFNVIIPYANFQTCYKNSFFCLLYILYSRVCLYVFFLLIFLAKYKEMEIGSKLLHITTV